MLENIIAQITPLDEAAMEACQVRLDNLTKPLNSLYHFEQLARKLAGITGLSRPAQLKKSIIVMAADHGICQEGVSAYPRQVTGEMMRNACQGGAAINVFAAHRQARLLLVDVGVATELPPADLLWNRKIAAGTGNIAQEAAMTAEQAMQAVQAGLEAARAETAAGSRIIGLGAMGIGSTLPSAAIIACLGGSQPKELIRLGVGKEAMLERRLAVLEQVLMRNCQPGMTPLEVLAAVGGLEIAGLVGVILGAAAGKAAVVLDGLATTAAACIAVKLAPQVKDYLVASHYAWQPAQAQGLKLLELPAYWHLDMHLGEGVGAAQGIALLEAALHVLNDMKTFGEAKVAVAQDGPGALKQRADVV